MKISSNIVILGAKPIKGMKSIGTISSVPVYGHKSILDLQLHNLKRRFHTDNIVYVRGYMGDKLSDIDHKEIKYVDNNHYSLKNNAYSLKLAAPYLKKYDSTLILFNKVLFHYKIFNYLTRNKDSKIIIDNSSKNFYKIGCNINSQTNIVNNLFYGLDNKLCGIYFLRGRENDMLMETLESRNNLDNEFVFEIINSIIEQGGRFSPMFVDHKLVNQIDSNSALKKTIKYYAKNFSS